MIDSINNSFITKKTDLVKFKNQTHKIFKNNRKEYIKNIDLIVNLIKKSDKNTYSEVFDLINSTYDIITNSNPDKSKGSLTFSFLRGTIYHIYAYLYSHSLAVHCKEKSFNYINFCFDKTIDLLTELKLEINNIKID